MRISRGIATLGVALSLVMMNAVAAAGEATVTDPRNDTTMGRGGPDIVGARINYGQRIVATLRYASSPESLGTISGVNLAFRNGRTYTLQRRAADPTFGTPLTSEIVLPTGARARCTGVTSSTDRAARTVTVSAPAACFAGRGTALKAQGFSFTRNFDSDETRWSGWVAGPPKAKKKPAKKPGKRKRDKPSPGSDYSLRVNVNKVDCATGAAQFSARGEVRQLPYGTKNGDRFYLDKEIIWDRSTSAGYREMDQHDYDSPIFTRKNLTFATTLADSFVVPLKYLGDNIVSIHVKSTLRQVRTGPDKRIWVDDRRVWLRGQACSSINSASP